MAAIDKWKSFRCNATCVAFTGLGKTLMGLIAIRRVLNAKPNASVVVIAPSQPVAKKWKQEVAKCTTAFENVKVITLAIAARDYVKFSCDLLVIDEIHLLPTPKNKSALLVKRKMTLGLTATYERLDEGHKLIDKVCPVADNITLAEGIRNGWTSDHKVYVVLCRIDNLNSYNAMTKRFKELFEWFNYKFDIPMAILKDRDFARQYAEDFVVPMIAEEYGMSRYRYDDKLIKEALSCTYRNSRDFIKTMTERKNFLYHHPKKLEIAEKIIKAMKGKKGITFWSTIEDAEKVSEGRTYASVTSDSDRTEKGNRETLDWFMKTDGAVINTVRALNVGFDCPEIQYGIVAGFNSSQTNSIQRVGRVIRVNEFLKGKKAEVFYIVIRYTNDEHWAAKALEKTEYVMIDEDSLDDFLEGKQVEFINGRLRTGNRY